MILAAAAALTAGALSAGGAAPARQLERTSDGAPANISTLSAGGYANAAAQDSFCSGTYCTANSSCVSFETANGSGDFARHSSFQLFLEPSDGSAPAGAGPQAGRGDYAPCLRAATASG
jgi:alpha-L-arabinofuranosidase B-like protein